MPKINIVCADCGSEDVHRDANADWNVDTQQWELGAVFDQGYCGSCGEERELEEQPIIEEA